MLGVAVQPVEFELLLPVSKRERRTAGLLLVGVDDDTPASRAGLKVGDVILAAGGKPVVDGEALHDVLSDNTLNANLQLHVFRSGSINEVAVELAGPPQVETAS
ncbi:MAG TPA: PDZ domain-containing protein [Chloroflexia bacterium]|nr:PDZ domain-containing protein [Chloroflexia bacterium]